MTEFKVYFKQNGFAYVIVIKAHTPDQARAQFISDYKDEKMKPTITKVKKIRN